MPRRIKSEFLIGTIAGEDIRPKGIDQMNFIKLDGIVWQVAGCSEALYSFLAPMVTIMYIIKTLRYRCQFADFQWTTMYNCAIK
jgi:hypothetical protein